MPIKRKDAVLYVALQPILVTTASHLFQDMHLRTEGSTTEMLYLIQFEVTVLFELFFTISRGVGIYPGHNVALLTRSPMTLSRSKTAALRLNL